MKLRFSLFFFLSLVIHASVVTEGLNLFSSHEPSQAALPQRSGGLYKTTLRLITVPKKTNKSFVLNKNKQSKVKSAPSDIKKAKLKSGLEIKYPFLAKKNNLSGTVVLRVKVGVTGVVEKIVVKTSSGHKILDQEAVKQLISAKFYPKTIQGKPVTSNLDVAINFKN